jgi:tetratricopeptide (TPR) repeat protein
MRSTRFLLALLFAAATLHAGETSLWQTDWNTAFKIAKEQHRLVFVDYFASGCSSTMEDTVSSNSDVQKRLNDFVLLREDFSHFNAPHGVPTFPTYAAYDYDERERFRFGDPDPFSQERYRALQPASTSPLCWYGWRHAAGFISWLDVVRSAAPSFVRAAEMLDSGNELEADVLLGNTYARFREFGYASAMYERARGLAEKSGNRATAQVLQMQSAFLVAREGNPARAIKLLGDIAATPVNQENEALILLTLGHTYQLAKDPKSARGAYQRVLSIAAPESRTYKEADAAIAKLH